MKATASVKPIVPQSYKALPYLTGLSVAVLIISNLASTKITAVGPAVFDAGTILFPLAYIISDIVTEIYGYKLARTLVVVGFVSIALLSLVLLAVQYLPAGPGFDAQSAYERILGFVPRIVLASFTAYLFGQFLNITILSKLKAKYGAQKLWARLVGSSAVGELIDTLIFSTIAFAGTLAAHDFWVLILTVYLIKLGFDLVASPFEIAIIRKIKKIEGIAV